MFLYLLSIGAGLVVLAIIPYITYLLGVTFGKKPAEMDLTFPEMLPPVSIVICAYNEELTIARKIQSISYSTYPDELTEVVLVIDCSDDKTEEVAQRELENVKFSWTIHTNEKRSGQNASLNTGISLTSNEIVIATDADLVWDAKSAEYLVQRLLSDDRLAAGTGDLLPNPGVDNITSMEKTYRSYYGRMAEWEYAHDATLSLNGCLLIFKKSIVSSIDATKGANDANLAYKTIREGYKTFYDTRAPIYEELPENLKKQYKQKVRRAKTLIQATLANVDLMKVNRPACRIFYPLRFWMYVITPTLLVIGGVLFSIGLILCAPIIFVLLVGILLAVSILKPENLITSFMLNQFYLLMGLYSPRRNAVIWKSTSKKVGE